MKISIAYCVGAFRTAAGIFYALFESSRDAAQAVSTVRSQCVAFGSLFQVTSWIFARAAECEIGLIQGPHGRITPEHYVREWRAAMATPFRMFTQPVFLDTNSPFRTIPTDHPVWYHGNLLPRAIERLRAQGYHKVADRLAMGEGATLDLHQDAVVIAELFGYDPTCPPATPKQIIRPQHEGVDTDLKPVYPQVSGAHPPRLELRRLTGTRRFVLRVQDRPAIIGTLDELFTEYMQVAAGCEWRWQGGVEAITSLRQTLDGTDTIDAPHATRVVLPIEPGTGILVSPKAFRAMALYPEIVAELALRLDPFSFPGGELAFSYDEAVEKGLAEMLTCFPLASLTYISPSRMHRYLRTRESARAIAA